VSTVNYKPFVRAERVPVVEPVPRIANIAAFELTNAEHNVASILAEYELGNTDFVTIGLPLQRAFKKLNTFFLAIRFVNENNDVIRYVLHRPNKDVNLFFPDYSSQPIGAAAVFEVWANPSETNVTTNGKALSLIVNDLTYYTGNDTRYIPNITPATTELTPTEFVSTPSGPSNPFVDNAELTN